MTRIHFNGIAAGAMQTLLFMPNDRFETHMVIIIGVSNFYTAKTLRHRQRLPWRPQTLLADFDLDFVQHSVNFTGYANLIGLDGNIRAVRLLRSPNDLRQVIELRTQMRNRIADKLTTMISYRLPQIWQVSKAKIYRLLNRYRRVKLTLERMLTRLQFLLTQDSLVPSSILSKLFAAANAISRDYERRFDALMVPAFMITHARRVGNAMYTDAKYELLKATLNPPDNDRDKAKHLPYRVQLFSQFFAIQELFEQHQIPLYDPREQQRIEEGERLWPEADLHTYTQLGVLSEAT